MPDDEPKAAQPDSTTDMPAALKRKRREKLKKPKPVRDARYFYENARWRFVSTAVWELLLIGGLVATVLAGMAASDEFLGQARLTKMLGEFLVPAMLVAPMVLIIAAGGIDFSVAAVAVLAGILVGTWAPEIGPQQALLRGLGVAAGIGLVNGLLVSVVRIHGAIVTLGTMFAVTGVCQLLGKGAAAGASGSAAKSEGLGFLATLPGSPIPWIALAVCGVIGVLLVQCTPMGRRPKPGEVRDPVEGRFARGFYTTLPYLLSGLAAGCVGVYLHVASPASVQIAGGTVPYTLVFLVVTAAVLGGTPVGGGHGTVLGGLLACLLLVVGGNVAALKKVPLEQVVIAQGAILLAAALLARIFFGIVSWRFDRK